MEILFKIVTTIVIPLFSGLFPMCVNGKKHTFSSESIDSTVSKIKIIDECDNTFRKSQLIMSYFNISLSMYNSLSEKLHFIELLNLINFIKNVDNEIFINYDYKSKSFIKNKLRKNTCLLIYIPIGLIIFGTYLFFAYIEVIERFIGLFFTVFCIVMFFILMFLMLLTASFFIYNKAVSKTERFFSLYIKR